MDARRVAVVRRQGLSSHEAAPFERPNPVYQAVEDLFRAMGLDEAHAGTPEWNPLGELIRPGDRVIVKPNLVSSRNLHEKIAGKKYPLPQFPITKVDRVVKNYVDEVQELKNSGKSA